MNLWGIVSIRNQNNDLNLLTEEYNSAQWVDTEDNDICDPSEFIYEQGETTSNNCNSNDDLKLISESPEFINYQTNVIIIGTTEDGDSINQNIWNITVLADDLQTVLNNNNEFSSSEITIEYPPIRKIG